MRATGIVRRIDDLGRVVIPKEIRRQMKIHEGDPLEIFTEADGTVCFKRYNPIGEQEWDKVKAVVKRILPEPFAIFDRYDECVAYTSTTYSKALADEGIECDIKLIRIDGEVEGKLVTSKNCENVDLAVSVMAEMLANN